MAENPKKFRENCQLGMAAQIPITSKLKLITVSLCCRAALIYSTAHFKKKNILKNCEITVNIVRHPQSTGRAPAQILHIPILNKVVESAFEKNSNFLYHI